MDSAGSLVMHPHYPLLPASPLCSHLNPQPPFSFWILYLTLPRRPGSGTASSRKHGPTVLVKLRVPTFGAADGEVPVKVVGPERQQKAVQYYINWWRSMTKRAKFAWRWRFREKSAPWLADGSCRVLDAAACEAD